MTSYDFELNLPDFTEVTDDLMDQVYNAGCDDCTLSSRNGLVTAAFTRPAVSLAAAINSAIDDLKEAGIKASPMPGK